MTSPSSIPDPQPWPEDTFPLQEVQKWIMKSLHLPSGISIMPATLYAVYTDPPDLRLTARFRVKRNHSPTVREVIYKETRFPLLAASGRTHDLVSRYCSGLVPEVVALEDSGPPGDPARSHLLYMPFEGEPVDGIEPLIETARTMAHIQKAVAASGEAESANLPQVTDSDTPIFFDSVVTHIAANIIAWETDESGKLSQWLRFPATEILPMLQTMRPQIIQCADAVAALDLPFTIDHGDLHSGNAVVQHDGTILIYDWETATVGCPLFSVEKLLVSAWRLDANPGGGGPWGYIPDTPTQVLVRDAYLQALGRDDINAGAFAAAMCLATVKEMHAEIIWANEMRWQNGNPEWTAQLISRLMYHLQSVTETERR